MAAPITVHLVLIATVAVVLGSSERIASSRSSTGNIQRSTRGLIGSITVVAILGANLVEARAGQRSRDWIAGYAVGSQMGSFFRNLKCTVRLVSGKLEPYNSST